MKFVKFLRPSQISTMKHHTDDHFPGTKLEPDTIHFFPQFNISTESVHLKNSVTEYYFGICTEFWVQYRNFQKSEFTIMYLELRFGNRNFR